MPNELNSFSTNCQIGCPFFREQHRLELRCEGIFEGQRFTTLKFATEEAKNEQIYSFCSGSQFYKSCPLASSIQEKYELENK